MQDDLTQCAYTWITAEPDKVDVGSDYYCQTRDVFQARFDKMVKAMFSDSDFKEEDSYIISAIAGEIGNNSFDHNVGNWRDIPGIFFAYDLERYSQIIIADRGRGIFETLKIVKPELGNDQEALKTAFTERISGRAPESRGNGLKFVRENIKSQKMHLTFYSGTGKAELNEKMLIEENSENIQGCLAIITS